jgi:amidase
MTALVANARAAPATAAPAPELEEVTVAQLQAQMASGGLTAQALVQKYQARINVIDPGLNSIIELNPDAEAVAMALDAERRAGRVRGPLHGIPVLLKDNVDTHDRMQTTAGSIALLGTAPSQDATVAAKLRAAGAVILGKTNLSEWANFRSLHSSSGWCGRGGQCNNPYALDRNPCGSSSGSGAAPSANLTTVSIGTETDGSIVCPANANGVVGIKPTVGLVSRAGVIPISHSQDTVGPHTRTVADAAAVLGAIASKTSDPRDAATSGNRNKVFTDYTQFLDANGLRGARIGVARAGVSGYSEKLDAAFEDALDAMRAAGAILVDPADIPTIDEINGGFDEFVVLIWEFRDDLNTYLATRSGVALDREGYAKTLAGLIAFNKAHAAVELEFFQQEIFDLAEARSLFGLQITPELYASSLAHERQIGGAQGIDAVLQQYNLDALVAETGAPPWTTDLIDGDHFLGASSSPAAIAGYPIINVPMGTTFGLPVGISFMGTAYSEPKLIKLASGFEAATKARTIPQLFDTLPLGAGGPTKRKGKSKMRRTDQPARIHNL